MHAKKFRLAVLSSTLCIFPCMAQDDLSLFDSEMSSSVSLHELAASQGKSGLTINRQHNASQQSAVLEHNALSAGITGNNSLADSAFSGASGVVTVIQNTGNQVIIQDTTMINVIVNN